jgi:hypothetical protein
MSARIESYLYSEGSKTIKESTTTLTAGGTDAILSATTVFADALAEWQTELGGAYTVAWNAATNSAKITNSGVFTLAFTGNLHEAMGFSAATGHTGASSYTGDQQALARFDVIKVDCDVLTDGGSIDLRKYRHRRAEVLAFGNHDLWRTRLWMTAAQATSFLPSYCAAGYIRMYMDSSNTTAYSATNADGYIDGYITMCGELETHGNAEEVVSVSMIIARPR